MTTSAHHQQIDPLRHIALVRRIAGSIHRRLPAHVELEDLVSEGTVGLLAAARGYESSRGRTFEQYARHRIQGAIVDSLRARDWAPRSARGRARCVEHARTRFTNRMGRSPSRAELAEFLELSLDAFVRYEQSAQAPTLVSTEATTTGERSLLESIPADVPDGLERMVDEERRQAVLQAVRELPERERAVISLHYLRSLSLAEIGRVLGVTESRVCQIKGQAIRRLRTRLSAAFA